MEQHFPASRDNPLALLLTSPALEPEPLPMDLEEPERALEIIRGPPANQIGWNPFPIKSHREFMALDRHLRLDGDKFNQVVSLSIDYLGVIF